MKKLIAIIILAVCIFAGCKSSLDEDRCTRDRYHQKCSDCHRDM